MNKPIFVLMSDVDDVKERMSYLCDTLELLLRLDPRTTDPGKYCGAITGVWLYLDDLTNKLDSATIALDAQLSKGVSV